MKKSRNPLPFFDRSHIIYWQSKRAMGNPLEILRCCFPVRGPIVNLPSPSISIISRSEISQACCRTWPIWEGFPAIFLTKKIEILSWLGSIISILIRTISRWGTSTSHQKTAGFNIAIEHGLKFPWRIHVCMVDWCDNKTGVFVDGKCDTICGIHGSYGVDLHKKDGDFP